jgi:tetratricopeptide (TPR) repeat protein
VLERLGHPPAQEAALALYRGNALMYASRLEAALAELELAVERSEGVPEAERIHLAALNNLASVQGQQGHYREAIRSFERSLALTEERLGPWHPIVGTNYLNLGVTQARLEELDAAMRNNQRALDIYLKSLGPEHGEIGRAYHNLGVIQISRGDVQAAYESYRKGLEIKQRALGPDHTSVAFSANNVGDALRKLGRTREAIPYCEEALRIWTKARGEQSPTNIYPLISLAEAHLVLDEPQQAETYIRRALALGEVGEIDPIEIAKARFVAGRAIWDAGGDRNEALALAEQARQNYQDSERPSTNELAAIAAWLAERR